MVERAPGTVIREARERQQMTQAQLAKRLGVGERTVRMWETTSTVPRSRRYALAAELGLGEDFAQPETWGRAPDLTVPTNGHDHSRVRNQPQIPAHHTHVPAAEQRRLSRFSYEYRKSHGGSGQIAPDPDSWSEIASYLLILRSDLDGVIRYVMQRIELGEAGQNDELER